MYENNIMQNNNNRQMYDSNYTSYRNQRRRNPNGKRSPKSYYERTTTIRFVQPSTGRAVCTKLNHVQRTKVNVENGTCLCENFLRGHCDFGNTCPLAHVPKQYLWDFLIPSVNRDTLTYDKGFKVRCYTPLMDAYYDIPSEWIYITRGSEKYIELYNDNGDNFKEKCKLCDDLQRTGCCERGGECEDVHCCCADISQFPCIRTHLADAEAVRRYARLDRQITVRVFQPNSGDDSQDFYGDDVLRTAGATQYEEAFLRENGVPNVKMQHCAHFQNKKLCRLGDGCRFLHVVSIALATPPQDDDDITPRLSPTSDEQEHLSPPTHSRAIKNSAAYHAVASMTRSLNNNNNNSVAINSTTNKNYTSCSHTNNITADKYIMSSTRANENVCDFPSKCSNLMGSLTGLPTTKTGLVAMPGVSQHVGASCNHTANQAYGTSSCVAGGRVSPNSLLLRVPVGNPSAMAGAEIIQLPNASNIDVNKSGGRVSPSRRNNPYALSPS